MSRGHPHLSFLTSANSICLVYIVSSLPATCTLVVGERKKNTRNMEYGLRVDLPEGAVLRGREKRKEERENK